MRTHTNTNTTATPKQVAYALALLAQAGRRTDYMDASYKDLATMAERSGTVENWLTGMSRTRISRLISDLAGN